jgi:hypothetical protein
MVVFGWKITLDEMEIGPTDATDTHMDPDLPWRREWDRLLDSAEWCGIDGSRRVDHPCRHCLDAHRVLIDRRSSFFNVFAFAPRPTVFSMRIGSSNRRTLWLQRRVPRSNYCPSRITTTGQWA